MTVKASPLRILYHLRFAIPLTMGAVALGKYINRIESEHMTRFRGKSALYGREYKPGEKAPWP